MCRFCAISTLLSKRSSQPKSLPKTSSKTLSSWGSLTTEVESALRATESKTPNLPT